MDLHAHSLLEMLRLGRSVSDGPARFSPRLDGLEVAFGGPAGPGFRGVLRWRGAPPRRTGSSYELSHSYLGGLLELLDRQASVSLRIAEDMLQLWTPQKAFQATRVGPRSDGGVPELVATARMDARVAAHLGLSLATAARTASDGPARLLLTLTPAVGNLCLLVGSEALTSLSLGPGSDVPAELESDDRRQTTAATLGLEKLLLEADDGEVVLSITSNGGIFLRGSSYPGTWEAWWAPETLPSAPEGAPQSPEMTPAEPVERRSSARTAHPSSPIPSPLSPPMAAGLSVPSNGQATAVSSPPASDLSVPLAVPDPDTLAKAWNGTWMETMAELWAQHGWKPASPPENWQTLVEHWSRVLAHLKERWPDLSEPPWEVWDPSKASVALLPRLLLDPRVLLAHVATDSRLSPGFLSELGAILAEHSKKRSVVDHLILGSPSREGEVSLRSLSLVGFGSWRPDEVRPSLQVPGELSRALGLALAKEEPMLWVGRVAAPSVTETLRLDAGPHLPLAVLLALARRGELRVTQTGELYKSSTARLQEALALRSSPVVEILRRIASDLDLVRVVDGYLRPTNEAEGHFARSPEDLRARWLATVLLDAGPIARATLYTLDELPPGTWLTTLALGFALEKRVPRMGGPRRAGPMTPPPSLALPSVLSALLLAGMVEVSGTEAFLETRLTDTARAVIAGGGVPPPPPGGASSNSPPSTSAPFHVLPDFEVAVPAEHLRPSDAWALAQAADLVSADRVVRFRLTRERIADAAREGLDGDRLLRLLRERSPRPVPGNVAHAIMEWGPASVHPEVLQTVELQGVPAPGEGAAQPFGPTLEQLCGRIPRGGRIPGRLRRWGEGEEAWGQLLLSPTELSALREHLEESVFGGPVPKGLEEIWEFLGAQLPSPRGRTKKVPAPTLEEVGGLGLPPRSPLEGRPAPPRLPAPPRPQPTARPAETPITEVEQTLIAMIREKRIVTVQRQVRGTSVVESAMLTPYCLVEGPEGARYLVAEDHRSHNLQLLRTSRFVEVAPGRPLWNRRSSAQIEEFLESLPGPLTILEPALGSRSETRLGSPRSHLLG